MIKKLSPKTRGNNLMPHDINLVPEDSDLVFGDTNSVPRGSNLVSGNTNLVPCDSNSVPGDTNLVPGDTNSVPRGTNSVSRDSNLFLLIIKLLIGNNKYLIINYIYSFTLLNTTSWQLILKD